MVCIDLSHTIVDGLETYPGIPAPSIRPHLTFDDSAAHYAPGTEFQIATMTLAANTGTYLDTPAHRFRSGWDLAELDLARCADLPVTVVRCRDRTERAVGSAYAPTTRIVGHAVLFDTGWDRHWGTPEYASGRHPHLSERLARHLVESDVALVGIDSLNIDATDDGTRPVHSTLLEAGIPIVEHLTNLRAVPGTGGRFFATPPRIAGMATFPVRAFVLA